MGMFFGRMWVFLLVCALVGMVAVGDVGQPARTAQAKTTVSEDVNLNSSGTLDRVLDSMVEELYGGVPSSGAKGLQTKYVRLEGIAWESPEGNPAGTSTLGAFLNDRVEVALSKKSEVLAPEDADAAKGFFGAIVSGSYKVLKAGVRVSLRLVDRSSGSAISEVSRELGWDLFPEMKESDIEPPKSNEAQTLGALIDKAIGSHSSEFALRVTTDRGSFGSYTVGEKLTVLLESEKDCYVRVYHISWEERTMRLIFPNRSEQNGFLPAGKVRRIPGESMAYSFEVAEPYGVDAIVVVASLQPFSDEEELASRWEKNEDEDMSDETSYEEDYDDYEDYGRYDDSHSEEDYWFEEDISAKRVEQIVAKGLIVRDEGESVSQTAEKQSGEELPPSFDLPQAESQKARATCYFITVNRLF